MISFIQVIDVLRTFAHGHLQIQKFDFEFREQMPNLATVNEAYPMLYVVPVGTSNIQFGKEFDLDIYCVDRYKKDRSNVSYVISDTELILSDLSVYLENQTVFDSSYGSTTPINNDLLDYVGGHVMRIRVTVEKQALCELPFDSEAPTPPTCPSALVRNSDGTWSEIVPSGATYTLPDTPVTVLDSDGNVLFTTDVVSITGGNVTAPDATYLVEYENGTPIESGSILSGGSAVVQVPNPIVCEDATVNVNGTLFDTVASGDTIDIQVYKSTGNDQIGSKQGQYWRIPDSTAVLKDTDGNTLSTTSIKATESEDIIAPAATVENSDATYTDTVASGATLVLPDTTIEVNGVTEGVVPSVNTVDIQLTDGTNPVTPVSVTVVGNVVTAEVAACPPAVTRSTATLMKTGQTTSYRTGDDGDIEAGRATNFLTLDAAPVHNDGSPTINTTTNRFTDTLGGSSYANNIVLDWSTWNGSTLLGWDRRFNGGNASIDKNWNSAIDEALSHSVGTFTSGWFLPNCNQAMSLINYESPSINYAPFNIASNGFWLSTTLKLSTSFAYRLGGNDGQITYVAKTTTAGYRWLAVRIFSLSTSNILS